MEDKTKELEAIKSQLISSFREALNKGIRNISACDLREMADAIKDITEAMSKCYEAEYYKSVTKAMEERDDPEYEKYYYHPPYPRMGYDAPKATAPYRDNAWRMNRDWSMNNAEWRSDPETERYGRTYSDYRKARKNYTETHNENDRTMMKETASRHVDNTIASIQEMWNEADPELKSRMKTSLSKLVNEMQV